MRYVTAEKTNRVGSEAQKKQQIYTEKLAFNLMRGRRKAWIKRTTLIRKIHTKERNEPIHLVLCTREGR